MSDSFVQVAPDDPAGKKIQTYQSTVGANTVQAQAVVLVDSAGAPYTPVLGPASATDSHMAVFDGATGKLIKDGGVAPVSLTPTYTVNVKAAPYNAVGDGVTDDTTAIQAAITDVFNAGGGTIFFPKGTYFVNGAFDATTNSILKIPMNAYTNPVISIALVGEVHAPWITNLSATSPAGVVIKATKVGTGTRPSILAGAAHMVSPGVTNFNAVFLSIKGMTFRTYDNPTIDALNLRLISRASLEDVAVDTDTQNPSLPTGGTYGIDMPQTSNYAVNILNRVAVQGYDKGIGAGEHFTSVYAIVAYCNVGVLINGGNDQGAVGNFVIVWCPKFMLFIGDATVDLNLDLERSAAGPWYATTRDIDGGTFYCKGMVRYTLSDNTGTIAGPINAYQTGDIMFVNLYNGHIQWNTDTGLQRDSVLGGGVWVTDGGANFRELKARSVKHSGVTVANLPASAETGQVACVTDGTAALAWGATVTGGGAAKYVVCYNGTNWTVMGK